MRLLRVWLLLVLLACATCAVTAVVLEPLHAGWLAVRVGGAPSGAPGADLAAMLTGGCALLAALVWLWLLAAVASCTWEALHAGPAPAVRGTTLWRPRLVRVLVVTCLGVSAVSAPAAHAQSPPGDPRTRPEDLRATAASPAAGTLRLLDGLSVPDRATGGVVRRVGATLPRRPPGRPPATADRTIHVSPGDSLWSLTARLLPAGSPLSAVAAGWRLLYAANRDVVGPDPDLLRPGQTLRVDPALQELVRATHAGRPSPPHHPPLVDHAGGSR